MTNEQRAIEALRKTVEFLRSAPLSTGVCCCGDSMDRHPSPLTCGHCPEDSGGHAVAGLIDELSAALAAVDAQPAEPPLTHGDIGPLWTACGGSELSSEQWSVMHRFVRRIAAQSAEPVRLLVKCMACGHKNYVSKDEAARNPVVAEPVQEPVAYGYWNKHLGWYGLSLQPGGSYTEPDRRPLYAAPPAPQRQPLTESRIVACLVEAGCLGTVRMSYDSGPYEITRTSINADKFARAVERAHGIGGDK